MKTERTSLHDIKYRCTVCNCIRYYYVPPGAWALTRDCNNGLYGTCSGKLTPFKGEWLADAQDSQPLLFQQEIKS